MLVLAKDALEVSVATDTVLRVADDVQGRKECVDAVSTTARGTAIADWRLVGNFKGPLGV